MLALLARVRAGLRGYVSRKEKLEGRETNLNVYGTTQQAGEPAGGRNQLA